MSETTNPPVWWDREQTDEEIDAYAAVLGLRLQREGRVAPTYLESQGARRLVERGEAQWDGPMAIVPKET